MTETGNSGIRALLQKFLRTLKLALWLIVFATVVFAGTVACNTID